MRHCHQDYEVILNTMPSLDRKKFVGLFIEEQRQREAAEKGKGGGNSGQSNIMRAPIGNEVAGMSQQDQDRAYLAKFKYGPERKAQIKAAAESMKKGTGRKTK